MWLVSDPRKTFVCRKCGYQINDKHRKWGKETPCPYCVEAEYLARIEEKNREKLKNV